MSGRTERGGLTALCLARTFAWLAAEPGIGVLTREPGVGKSSAMRHLCRGLPESDHRVVYLCDCAVKPHDLYRMLATELGLRPGPRAHIVRDIKGARISRRRARRRPHHHPRPTPRACASPPPP